MVTSLLNDHCPKFLMASPFGIFHLATVICNRSKYELAKILGLDSSRDPAVHS